MKNVINFLLQSFKDDKERDRNYYICLFQPDADDFRSFYSIFFPLFILIISLKMSIKGNVTRKTLHRFICTREKRNVKKIYYYISKVFLRFFFIIYFM